MEISPSASRPAGRGPAETFTGEVSVKPLFDANDVRVFSSAEVSLPRALARLGTPTPADRP